MLALEDFRDDPAWEERGHPLAEYAIPDQIEGVVLQRIVTHEDSRGDLSVLLSTHYARFDPLPPHVYLVSATPRSIRAWVFHKRQSDRLAYTNGEFRVVLYDLRPQSPTLRQLNILTLGKDNKTLLTIPPFVAHGVQNLGGEVATFINMPTRVYDPGFPDKSRAAFDHPGIPYRFEP